MCQSYRSMNIYNYNHETELTTKYCCYKFDHYKHCMYVIDSNIMVINVHGSDVRQSETRIRVSAPRSCAKDGRWTRGRPPLNSEYRVRFIYYAHTRCVHTRGTNRLIKSETCLTRSVICEVIFFFFFFNNTDVVVIGT